MVDHDKPIDLVPVDDPRVTAYRKVLYDTDEWKSGRAGRNDRKAAYDEAGVLLGRLRDLIIEASFLDVVRDRMAMEWETTQVNPEWPEAAAGQRRTLMAMKRAVVDLGPAFLGPGSTLIAGDLVIRAAGSPSLIDAEIPRATKYGHNPALMDAAKPQSIRLAHFNAGLERSDWRSEHAKIYPGISDSTRDNWNALVSNPERQDCRRVGALARRKAPLTAEDETIQAQALRYEAAALREWIRGP
jgi:hypothetical protein